MPDVCVWTEDESGVWDTGCGNAFAVNESMPSDNGMRFCCYCGSKLEQCPHDERECQHHDA